jgi:hemoglobin
MCEFERDPVTGRKNRPVRISNDMIIKLVDLFYEKIRAHSTLGPIFETAIGDRWDAHLPKMYKFWSSVLNSSGLYAGNPMRAHMQITGKVDPVNFGQWLTLFKQTLEELFSTEDVDFIYGKAENIAQSLSLGMFYNPASPHHQPPAADTENSGIS